MLHIFVSMKNRFKKKNKNALKNICIEKKSIQRRKNTDTKLLNKTTLSHKANAIYHT